ncbi:VCBS repeat-containing protein, partial [Akkermansiaceae bacterium]|nr:VCBS repeat-containing protein [Akkermansiaceae bacterium]
EFPASEPLKEASLGGETLFTEIAAGESGVEFVNPIDKTHPTKRLYLGAFACGGVAIGDLDGDGIHDLFLTSGPRRNRLYRGLGEMKFEDITDSAKVAGGEEWTAGATLVDIDADGDLDIHVCNYDAPNALWINDGKGVFSEQAKAFGLAISDASLIASFCDYDLDGDLDCFLLTRDFKRDGGRPEKHPVVKTAEGYELTPGYEKFYRLVNNGGGKWTYINAGREDYLLKNEGGRFVDVSKKSGISGRDRGNSATWWDYNNDGLPDLYVGNDFKDADRLYQNNGDGTFKDVISSVAPHTPWFSMGADFADFNGDGREDLLIADMAGTNHFRSKTTMGEIGSIRPFLLSAVPRQYMHNVLYLNQDSGLLVDASFMAGLAKSDWSWAARSFPSPSIPGRTAVKGLTSGGQPGPIASMVMFFLPALKSRELQRSRGIQQRPASRQPDSVTTRPLSTSPIPLSETIATASPSAPEQVEQTRNSGSTICRSSLCQSQAVLCFLVLQVADFSFAVAGRELLIPFKGIAGNRGPFFRAVATTYF